jgi:hypothetical protein
MINSNKRGWGVETSDTRHGKAGRNKLRRAALLAAAFLLHGCGGSSGPAAGGTGQSSADAGPPKVDAQGCTAYGDPPRPLATLSPDGTVNDVLTTVLNECTLNGGETLTDYTDSNGTPRKACLITGPGAGAGNPLPLLVYLHPTLLGEDTIIATGILSAMKTANLSGDPARPGFNLLMPLGRNIQQFLPFPLDTGVGWDHWYRNVDRSSPWLNVDVATIDHYIAEAKGRGIVDARRVYVTGWSEGADFGSLYGLNTPGIAATGVFSTDSPYDDHGADPCPSPASTINPTRPYLDIVRKCDIGGACQAAQVFLGQMRTVMDASLVHGVILDSNNQVVDTCDAACDAGSINGSLIGQQQHTTWPSAYNDNLFQYMAQNPEP